IELCNNRQRSHGNRCVGDAAGMALSYHDHGGADASCCVLGTGPQMANTNNNTPSTRAAPNGTASHRKSRNEPRAAAMTALATKLAKDAVTIKRAPRSAPICSWSTYRAVDNVMASTSCRPERMATD